MMGGSWSTWGESTHSQGEHAERPQLGIETLLEPSCCEVTVLTTTPALTNWYACEYNDIEVIGL